MMKMVFLIVIYAVIIQSITQVQSEDSLPNGNITTNDNYTNETENATSSYGDNSSVENTFENITSEVTELENITTTYLQNDNTTEEIFTENVNSKNTTFTKANLTNENAINETDENINSIVYPDENFVSNNRCPDYIDANDYVDRLLAKISENASDEMRLPSKHGFFTLTDGKVKGLLSMTRVNDADVTCNSTAITLEAIFRFEDLIAEYTWERSILFKTLTGRLILIVDEIDILFKIRQIYSRVYLDTFKIKKMRGINVEVTGMNYLTWTLSRLTNLMTNTFNRTMSKIVEGPLKEAFDRQIQLMDFPQV